MAASDLLQVPGIVDEKVKPNLKQWTRLCGKKTIEYMGVDPKIGGNTPKMDGLFHGKPY